MFDIDQFVADCRRDNTDHTTHKPIAELLERAMADPSAILKSIGEPKRAGVQALYRSEKLTVLNVIWGRKMTLMPHNHEMWAVIGIYTGREDNVFWRRIQDEDGETIERASAKTLDVGDTKPLGHDIIHSVTNPLNQLTGAIHVYGGDFFATPRSEWDPHSLREAPYDVDKNMRLFEASNDR
ncbi:MAG: putative metal-dependent enzyme (double-stranded beta helix superfamily) [Myxococcota bacterium]|jgi:predicted metal-dependent enzyme (double-stranded beta helix superfamily)